MQKRLLNYVCELIDNSCQSQKSMEGYLPIFSRIVYYYFRQSKNLKDTVCTVLKAKMDSFEKLRGHSKLVSHNYQVVQVREMIRITEHCISHPCIFTHISFVCTCISRIIYFVQMINCDLIIHFTPSQRAIFSNTFAKLFAKIIIIMDNYGYQYYYLNQQSCFYFTDNLDKEQQKISIHPIFYKMIFSEKNILMG